MILTYTRKELADSNIRKKKHTSANKATGDVHTLAKLLNKTRKDK